ADRALGTLLFGTGRARLHEAHLDPAARRRRARRTRTGRDRARRSRRARRACALGRNAAQPAMSGADQGGGRQRLAKVTLDEGSIGRSSPDTEHERAFAIYDLIEENSLAPAAHEGGPYLLNLSIAENRLVFDIREEDGAPVMAHFLSLTPFRRIVKDYFLICDSYYKAIRTAT